MNKLFITSQLNSFNIKRSVRSLKKKMKPQHQNIKIPAETPKMQSKKKSTGFEWLLFSNYFLEMNDFDGAVIK